MNETEVAGSAAEGGCQCGAIRFRVDLSRVLTLYRCHCMECQRQTASAFGLSMILPDDAFEILQGEVQSWTRKADSGRDVHCFFCAACGCRLFHRSPARPDMANLKPGSLDDTSVLRPIGDLWADRRQAWVDLIPGGVSYAGQPENLEALIARFQAGS